MTTTLDILHKIYQSCLAAFLTFTSKSCGPSYAAITLTISPNRGRTTRRPPNSKTKKPPLREWPNNEQVFLLYCTEPPSVMIYNVNWIILLFVEGFIAVSEDHF